MGSKGASPQALIDNIPIALCAGALNEFPPWSRHLRAILIFRQEWKNGRVVTCLETYTQDSGAGLEMRWNTQTLVLLPITTSSLRLGKRPVSMDVTE